MLRNIVVIVGLVLVGAGCGSGSDALGVAAECTRASDCNQSVSPPLECLTGFKGGYCGLTGCTKDADCPTDSMCVTHTDGKNYCFRTCNTKADCNANRTAANEANCSSNIVRVGSGNQKACVPPSA